MQNEEQTDNPLERLRKKLNSRTSFDVTSQVQKSATAVVPEPEHWKQESIVEKVVKKRMSTATLFLLFAAGFFVIAGITTATVLILGGRSISTDNVSVVIEEGPVTVAGGKATSFSISVTNNNPLPITGGALSVLFPAGTVEADDASVPLSNFSETLPSLAPGASAEFTVRAAFFGSENQKLSIPITVEYQTDNSNATFSKKTTYDFTISTSPVVLTAVSLSEVSSGQKVTVTVAVRSNAESDLENIAVRAEYPFGFSLTESVPEPVVQGLFSVGTLRPGEEKEIRITGVLTGQEGDQRVFRFSAGALKSPDSREFGVPYMVAQTEIQISKPFLAVGLSLNREESSTIVVSEGDSISGLLSWANSLSTPITDASISVTLSGEALDGESVDTTGGFYRSSTKTILFDKSTMNSLATLQPSDTGNGSFIFKTKTGPAFTVLRQPTMNLSVSVSGKRIGAGRVPETVTSTLSRTIKVETDLSLLSRIVRTIGSIENTGPWPPKVDTETTYTVQLEAKNTVNTVANAKVAIQLPSFVRYTGSANPKGEFSYVEGSRELLWTVGNMMAGETASAEFQIAFLPSVSQKGTSPILVPEHSITGVDRFTQTTVGGQAQALSTQTSDPTYQSSFGTVQP
jgi:hypothetical protein